MSPLNREKKDFRLKIPVVHAIQLGSTASVFAHVLSPTVNSRPSRAFRLTCVSTLTMHLLKYRKNGQPDALTGLMTK